MAGSTFWLVFEILTISLWVILLVPICYNIYHYLVLERKYKFIPMLFIYVGQVGVILIILVYCISKKIDGNERPMQAWIYFTINIRLACLIGILGFAGLVIELSLKLKMLQQSSSQMVFSQRRRITSPSLRGQQVQHNESTISSADSAGLAFNVNESNVGSSLASLQFSPPAAEVRGLQSTQYQSKLVEMNDKQTNCLEWIIFSAALLISLTYNTMAFVIAEFFKEEGVTNNQEFYESQKSLTAYRVFLIINCSIMLGISLTLIIATCRLVPNMRRFFKGQFKKESRALLCVTITAQFSVIGEVINDSLLTISQMKNEPLSETDGDTLIAGSLIVYAPILVFNILHYANIKSQQKNRALERQKENKDQSKPTLSVIMSRTEEQDSSESAAFIQEESHLSNPTNSVPYGTDSREQSSRYTNAEMFQSHLKRRSSHQSSSVNTAWHQYYRTTSKKSHSSFSRGLLIPDHVLMRQQVENIVACQAQVETPDVSDDDVSDSQNMSQFSQPVLDCSHTFDDDAKSQKAAQPGSKLQSSLYEQSFKMTLNGVGERETFKTIDGKKGRTDSYNKPNQQVKEPVKAIIFRQGTSQSGESTPT